MYSTVDPIRTHFSYGFHDEWNPREVRIKRLPFGIALVSCGFRDDGALHTARRRHADIPVLFRLPSDVDWGTWKVRVWSWLEEIRLSGY